MNGRPILAMPTPSPRGLADLSRRPRPAFPLVDPRTLYFHLARGAIHHAIRALELDGSDILVPAWHHGVEVEAIVAAGARPVFYGLRHDFSADLASLAHELTPETRALYVIHYIGFPQPMRELASFARGHGLKLIEDCALALFSRDGAIPLGARADAAIYCLYKSLPIPDGGALWMPGPITDPELRTPGVMGAIQSLSAGFAARWSTRSTVGVRARRIIRGVSSAMRFIGTLPGERHPVGHAHMVPGEERLSISPGTRLMLRRQDAAGIVERRRRNFRDLHIQLGSHGQRHVALSDGVCPLFYPLPVEQKALVRRRLSEAGIETIDFWRHGSCLLPAGRFPLVDRLRREILEIPIHQDLEPGDITRIAQVLRRTLDGLAPMPLLEGRGRLG